jgi:hypothetical protein
MKSKGQFFIIAAIIIVMSIILIRGFLDIYSTSESSLNEMTKIEDMKIENLEKEYEYSLGIASLAADPNASATLYLSNLSYYIRSQENAKILWLAVFVNGGDQKYSVVVGNYLQRSISLNISATNSTPSSASLTINDMANTSYNFTSLINGTINLTLSYIVDDNTIQNTFQLLVGNVSSTTGFFDISLLSDSLKIRTKKVYQRFIS